MIVTASTILGLTSLNGSFEVHFAMLIMLFWKVDYMIVPSMPDLSGDDPEIEMKSGLLVTYCKIMHAYLFVCTFMSQSPKFSNGVLLATANFVGLGLYIFVISKVAIELYDS